jgi:hypothetical protein
VEHDISIIGGEKFYVLWGRKSWDGIIRCPTRVSGPRKDCFTKGEKRQKRKKQELWKKVNSVRRKRWYHGRRGGRKRTIK